MDYYFQPGDKVVEIETDMVWTVLYHDKHFKMVTCEHREAGRFIVRAMREDQLTSMEHNS